MITKKENYNSDHLWLFSDGSVSSVSKKGFGAYLLINSDTTYNKKLTQEVQLQLFEHTSSSRLELQALLWALQAIPSSTKQLTVFTDSQTIVGLPGRRARLETNKYYTVKGKLLKNHLLYRDFFKQWDRFTMTLCKVPGHSPANQKGNIEKIFGLVDRAARQALRESL